MDRYSFPVGLFHPQLPAGLFRRFRSVPFAFLCLVSKGSGSEALEIPVLGAPGSVHACVVSFSSCVRSGSLRQSCCFPTSILSVLGWPKGECWRQTRFTYLLDRDYEGSY